MDKFIELLNQYEIERWTNRVCYWINIWVIMSEWVTYRFSYVISKEFGFIKRLVDNDKIDRDKCWFKNEWFRNWYDKWIALVENYDNDTYKVTEFYRPYFQLLMLLSIQGEPIEFLISILK